MSNLAPALVGLAALAFVMAAVTTFTGPMLVPAEGWSRACTNLALLALCLYVGGKDAPAAG